ncbi:haloacid dehalogenase type II [Oceanobacter sp. 5_MG-2023]|jgi:2-haloacid dehalogenase|uniref:haloacid dehalogenase type II n=1 Tax=Oceanobacter sp. 5_MG-2023 TaxID=3062645 RepID=UPI0026E22DDF|nr:haloacid dehalogenase type II [Oceanobacter sp. 5_MG-2023]MDO6682945.1 haloacid dehalogenase type II [Oceanobacter sp. 5_MG-2023]
MNNKTILFDINETVLDLSALKPGFTEVFGHESALPLWFSLLLHSSNVCIATKVSTNFAELSAAMLDSVAVRYGITLTDDLRAKLLAGFASLRPHADIKPALATLRSHGFRTVAFSNSSLTLIANQIKNAGLESCFDEIISVEETGSFKPDPAVYHFAAQKLAEPIASLRLVATHDWDTHGALSAGMQAAYIDRSGIPYHPFYRRPDIDASSMDQIVAAILQHSQGQ